MLKLTLVTPAKKFLENAPLKEVHVPAFRGEIEIRPGHAPLVTTLSAGVLRYKLDNTEAEARVAISWGYCEVTAAGEVNILAETAETSNDISLERAEAARKLALESLAKTNYEGFDKLERKFQRAEARIKAIKGG